MWTRIKSFGGSDDVYENKIKLSEEVRKFATSKNDDEIAKKTSSAKSILNELICIYSYYINLSTWYLLN